MGIIIDTNILIELEKGRVNLPDYISGREKEKIFISVITASELLHGVWRAADSSIRSRRTAFVEAILTNIPLLPIDLPVARVHAQIWAELQSKGIMIGLHDSWIAALCISNDFVLITSNIEEFKRVPGLKLECWQSSV
ncbi:MAG: hypothetical protein A2161_16475 [Candidatus Schekmanbacteria bacterium RBG_13_48_7]|uniref:Ribonuclease VapC n=1 Tax=Candidatus Schekmanbacteria bacterium RBG_13_48_7 TaxID=1817878 RepID=A0A1F7RWD9_9BACT|nr:MAG: hypothetical protein A2161_16475 [Candidatus Schekmanbacteria bacterium RBG_13_48_7]